MKKKLFLVDAYALIFRFHYAFISSAMRNPAGQNVSAVFGFTKFIYELLDREQPDYLGVAFDPKGGNFRHKLYPEYKANREATPEDIIFATPIIKEILTAMHIPILEVPGYEADDVIGTLSTKACQSGEFYTYMVTSDKDYGQLVTDCTVMYKPSKNGIEIWGEREVTEHFGIARTEQIIDILAIWGDASDNIPGVAGIGQKGAQKLIEEYGSVQNVIDNIENLKGATRTKVENSLEKLKLSRELATICREVPLDFSFEELRVQSADSETLREIYRTHNFRSFLQRLASDDFLMGAGPIAKQSPQGQALATPSYSEQKAAEYRQGSLFDPPQPSPTAPSTNTTAQTELFAPPTGDYTLSTDYQTIHTTEHNYVAVESFAQLQSVVEEFEKLSAFALDTETTSVEPMRAKLLGISLCGKASKAYWIPITDENREEFLGILAPLLGDCNIAKVGQNIKYDIEVLSRSGVEVCGRLYDTMIMHYLLDAEGRHSLDAMARNFLGYNPISIEELIGKGKNQLSMEQVPDAQICDYACEDADITLQLYEHFAPQVDKELYCKIEEPLIEVLSTMEMNGVKIDTEILSDVQNQLEARLAKIESEIFALAGTSSININSPKQLGELLFETFKLDPKAKKTKTGQYKTDEATLEKLQGAHPIVEQILEYRGLKKLLSTYVEALPLLINPKTGRVHTSFNQALTATGRLSSSNPNLQNIPIREEMGRQIRRAFVPGEQGWKMLSADYSQVELRIMAHLSEDKNLIKAFKEGQDIHSATAALIFNSPIDEVTSEQRRQAKTANFGIIYGISAFGLASRLNISRSEAGALISGYFASYPGVKNYMDEVTAKASELGYVETLFGRRRYLNDIASSNHTMRSLAQRNAINAPIQGTAADIMKLAMIGIYNELKGRKMQARMILQIHDEIVIECPSEEVEAISAIVVEQMMGAAQLSVPLEVNVEVAESWSK